MTAPRSVCRNTKKALAERGPSIHDGQRAETRAKRARPDEVSLLLPRNDAAYYVLLPAAVATTGNTSLAARSGVSSFQRTEPNGRSSMRRMRTASGPR